MTKQSCAHCGEQVPVVLCPVCGADVSDPAYHLGLKYALWDHADRITLDTAHAEYLEQLELEQFENEIERRDDH
jgi:hypothetical protein